MIKIIEINLYLVKSKEIKDNLECDFQKIFLKI